MKLIFPFFFLFAERFKYWFQEQDKVYFFCLSKWRRKRTIYYSSFYWLVTPELARPVFCSDSVMTPLTPLLFLPLALTSKSRQLNWEERKSNCRFGTQPVKNVSTQLLHPITGIYRNQNSMLCIFYVNSLKILHFSEGQWASC